MGCTAELMAFSDKDFVIGHMGDSRIRKPSSSKRHSSGSRYQKKLSLDLVRGIMFSGDLFLLCSDGLSDMIDDNLIRDILLSTSTLLQKVEKLIESANAAGGYDNITVVFFEIPELPTG